VLGEVDSKRFDQLLGIGTLPAVFRAYLDAYQSGMEAELEREFETLWQVAQSNAEILGMPPIDWSASHIRLMVTNLALGVRLWIRQACDKPDMNPVDSEEALTEAEIWKSWRAPRLIHMNPAGNTRYDLETMWDREGEDRTQELLTKRSDRFLQFLEIHLRQIMGKAHILSAQFPTKPKSSPLEFSVAAGTPSRSSLESDTNRSDAVSGEARQSAQSDTSKPKGLLLRYRSELKRAILIQLTQNPTATDMEVCRGLDADGSVEVPQGWKANVADRSFELAYKNPRFKRRVEVAISRIRTDLRNRGLMDRP
jgi:hypothetical protein